MATAKKKKTVTKTSSKGKSAKRTKQDYELKQDIKILLVIAIAIFLFVCNFGLIGTFGSVVSNVLFGVFGFLNYIFALFVAFVIVYLELYNSNTYAVRKSISFISLYIAISMCADLISGISKNLEKYSFKEIYNYSAHEHKGGGIIAGSINYGLLNLIDMVGTIIFIVVVIIISLIFITEKSLLRSVRSTHDIMKERSNEDKRYREELYEERRREAEERRNAKRIAASEERKEREIREKTRKEAEKQAKEDAAVLNRNKKVHGITKDTTLIDQPVSSKAPSPSLGETVNDDVHEINLDGFDPATLSYEKQAEEEPKSIVMNIHEESEEDEYIPGVVEEVQSVPPEIIKPKERPVAKSTESVTDIVSEVSNSNVSFAEYQFPPISLLSKGIRKAGDSKESIQQTAKKLEETLSIFGVEATVTEVSQGPTVTRFELQPKMGVKVSRIKNLSDDIKLNLAASEIRIEAPIPGKAAIGIEVPNKEAQSVMFRDLIEANEYKNSSAKLAFAIGKDIAGKTIVYGIENFPHLLIAGATGSGKSVCINTLIMSILYRVNPDDVKLIMIDPKVVELSVYNGIPHLMLPVVTDVKKASATLNYAVNEMQERYKKFAEVGARDLSGYNDYVSKVGEDSFRSKLPHIVIIVDEVADLMLQERKNVEDSICSLAQLARAAGIHLIIATQRPSVDVITGLIKANMPSRIAFAVSSGVDSRTILDMTGAEELLGKGDMLFFPKGLKKPVRLQGGFVSDREVNDVVSFLKNQGLAQYDTSIEEKIKSCEKKSDSGSGASGFGGGDDSGDGNDELFVDSGYFIIDSNKASIGMLQRKFRIGFNRAARIMDQLADAGVVGPEIGTKPRDILMSREAFENYLEEYGG